MSIRNALFACAAAAVLFAAPLAAHHSFAAQYDRSKSHTITGAVTKMEWQNPHIWVWLEVPNAAGQVETWGFEGMSPNFLARRGWTRTTLPAGAKITVTFRPLRDGRPGGMFMTGKLEDGKVLTSGGAQ